MQQPFLTDAALLAQIEVFCQRHGVKPSTFGRNVLGDGNLIPNLKDGRSLSLRNAEKVVKFMAEYQPADQASAA